MRLCRGIMSPELKLILVAFAALVALYTFVKAIQGIVYLLGYVFLVLLAALPFLLLITSIFFAIIYQKPSGGYTSSYIIILGFIASGSIFLIFIKSKLLKKIQLRLNPPPPPAQSYKIDMSTIPPPPPKKMNF